MTVSVCEGLTIVVIYTFLGRGMEFRPVSFGKYKLYWDCNSKVESEQHIHGFDGQVWTVESGFK